MGRRKLDDGRAISMSVRLHESDAAAVDAMAERLASRTLGGAPPSRAEVIRLALPRGLKVMSDELDTKGDR